MTAIQNLNRALLRTLMSPETADIVADRLEELEGVEMENRKLRAIFPKILEALGSGACSPDCSINFLQEIPGEVRAVVAKLKVNDVHEPRP